MYLMTETKSVALPFCLKMEIIRYSFLVPENADRNSYPF
jgi:hypothetical protein